MSPDKMSRTKCRGQNVMWTKCHWTKCHGQIVADKMSRTKCSGQNVVDKMSWPKCHGQKVVDTMSWTKCCGQNVVVRMSWTKCRGQYVLVKKCSGQDAPGIVLHKMSWFVQQLLVVLKQISQSLSYLSRLPIIYHLFQNIVELNSYLERESFTRNKEACLHSFVETGEATKWGVRCCMMICMFAIGSLLGTHETEQLNKCGAAPCPIFQVSKFSL